MGIFSGLRGQGGWTAPTSDPLVESLSEQLRQEQDTSLLLTESLADAELALEDRGWLRLTADAQSTSFTREGMKRAAEIGRVMAVTNTLVKRGLALRTAYIWGSGVQVAVAAGDDAQADANDVVQAFLDDPGNKAALTGEQAHEENERALGTDGNIFIALFTAPKTGRVQARTFGFDEVADVICNPDDKDDPWYYRRKWTATQVVTGPAGASTVTGPRDEFYPALGYRPASRPTTINGHPVHWDTPVLHVCVNRLDGWKFGIGDVYTAIPWARAYSEFLRDWAQLVKALSQFAFQLSAKGSKASKAAQLLRARTEQAAARIGDPASTAGATFAGTEGYGLEAISKSGATIDSESGRPLAAMVAAGLDLPVTMLLGDPGVTGARATAETLDPPMRLSMEARQTRHAEVYRRVCEYVIAEAVRAPAGTLRGAIVRDEYGREKVTVAGDVQPTIQVTFPSLDDVDVEQVVSAIVAADGTGKMPPVTTIRLLLQALGVDDVDELIDQVTDADGDWINPNPTPPALMPGTDPAGDEPTPPPPARAAEALEAVRPPGWTGHRALNVHEAAAGMDPEGIYRTFAQHTAGLVESWKRVRAQQIQALIAQVEQIAATGDVGALTGISLPGGDGVPELLRSMHNMAADALIAALEEATSQGVAVPAPDLDDLIAGIQSRAAAVSDLLSTGLAAAAKRAALTQFGPGADGPSAVASVRASLEGLSDAYLNEQLGGLMMAAQNEARMAVMDSGPPATYYASELLDDATCEPCGREDERVFTTIAEARRAYPTGGFRDCLGGSRCRGTLVAVYHEAEASAPLDQPMSAPRAA